MKNEENKNREENLEASGTASNITDSNSNETQDYTRTKSGYDLRKSRSELMFEYRKNIINITSQIIEELNNLFFALY